MEKLIDMVSNLRRYLDELATIGRVRSLVGGREADMGPSLIS